MKKLAYTFLSAIMLVVMALTASAQGSSQQTRQVSGFTSVVSYGPFNVHIKLDGTESVKIDADADAIDNIEAVVKDGVLKIRFKDYGKYHHSISKADIYVTAKTLSALTNSGSGNINVDGTMSADNFKAILSGSGSISAAIKANGLTVIISGSGSINLSGSAADADITIAGSGGLQGKGLQTETAKVNIAGSGNVYLKADKTVNASIIGSGGVTYSGNAVASTKTIGSGRVTKSED